MSGLNGASIILCGFIPAIQQLLEGWRPGGLSSEREYQESLFNFLEEQLPGCLVQREYYEAGSVIDIYLKRKGWFGSDEAFFELKYNLSGKPEFNRLIGQLVDMEPRKRKIIVVLCGTTERAMLQRLREHFKDYLNDDYNPWIVGDGEPHMAIVQKE